MGECNDDIALVRRAQQGHAEARVELVRIVEPRLAEYVGRLTLDRELTRDIVQESITEMLKIFNTLKDPERFWCWLYTITLNKTRTHYRQRWRRRETSLSDVQEQWLETRARDVVAELVTAELKEIVVRAVGQLEPRQRAVLTMRCYDQMSYEQISAAMGCSQLGARALFYRAKKTLTRLLRSRGVDKAVLPVALLVFGRFSATSEAAAAGVSIPASTLHVGLWGALAGTVTQSATTAILLGAALVGTGGVLAVRSGVWDRAPRQAAAVEAAPVRAVSQDAACWYYYPPGATDVVMIRTQGRAVAYSQWLQKEQANYYRQGDTIYVRNHRQFAPDLAVWRLPTDPPALRSFLQAQDQRDMNLDYVAPSPRGLLVAVEGLPNADRGMGLQPMNHRQDADATKNRGQDARDTQGQDALAPGRRQATLSYDVSMEDYFRHDWSMDAAIVDERNDRHREGWMYFTVSGRLGTRGVSGYGRVPLVAATLGNHGPWLKLTVEGGPTVLDSGATAEVRSASEMVSARYRGGSFFRGLGRPWSGLHTIDVIRRDAALAGIAFTTRRLPDGRRVEIVLGVPNTRVAGILPARGEGGTPSDRGRDTRDTRGQNALDTKEQGRDALATRLTYRVHLYEDWIETITFSREGEPIGEWTFSYPKPDEVDLRRLAVPPPARGRQGQSPVLDGLWLMRLAEGSLAP